MLTLIFSRVGACPPCSPVPAPMTGLSAVTLPEVKTTMSMHDRRLLFRQEVSRDIISCCLTVVTCRPVSHHPSLATPTSRVL